MLLVCWHATQGRLYLEPGRKRTPGDTSYAFQGDSYKSTVYNGDYSQQGV